MAISKQMNWPVFIFFLQIRYWCKGSYFGGKSKTFFCNGKVQWLNAGSISYQVYNRLLIIPQSKSKHTVESA